MKQIKPGEYTNAVCEFCAAPAQWRANRLYRAMYCCDNHREEIVKAERVNVDDGHMSEADEQTWSRLCLSQ